MRIKSDREKEAEKAARAIRNANNRARNLISLPTGRKKCPRCSIVKDFSDFQIQMSASDGRQVYCKSCVHDRSMKDRDKNNARSSLWAKNNKERRRETTKAWVENNLESYLANRKRYKIEKRDAINAGIKDWTLKNPDKVRAKDKRWNQNNKAKRAAIQKRSRLKNPPDPVIVAARNKDWRKRNPPDPKVEAAKRKAWRKANPDIVKAISRNSHARRKGAKGSHTKEEINALFLKQKGKCANPTCRVSLKSGYHADHIHPLALGGSNYIRNIQLLCGRCNRRKHKKDPLDWARENGLLL